MRMRMVMAMRYATGSKTDLIIRSGSSVAPSVALFFGRPIHSSVGVHHSAHSRTTNVPRLTIPNSGIVRNPRN